VHFASTKLYASFLRRARRGAAIPPPLGGEAPCAGRGRISTEIQEAMRVSDEHVCGECGGPLAVREEGHVPRSGVVLHREGQLFKHYAGSSWALTTSSSSGGLSSIAMEDSDR
jgi:hypothetical protein